MFIGVRYFRENREVFFFIYLGSRELKKKKWVKGDFRVRVIN